MRRTCWVVVDGVGRVGLVEMEVLDPGTVATFTLFIAAAERRKGYAVAAIEALLTWARTLPRVTELVTDTEDWNTPSIRAMIRTGFTAVNTVDDRITFRRLLAMDRDDRAS